MNDRQRRKYEAAVSGHQSLVDNAAAYAGNTPLIDERDALKDTIEEIETVEQAQEKDTKGFASDKGKKKTDMGTQAWIIAKLIAVFAQKTNNEVLFQEIDFEKSDLLFVADDQSKDRAKLVHDRGTANLAAMTAAGYQLTAGMLTNLQTATDAFESAEGTPEAAEATKVAATIDLRDTFKTLDGHVDAIEDLVVGYASSNTNFYNTILDAFEVQDIGVQKRAIRLSTNDNATGVRLSNATVKIIELNLVKQTSKRGIADFPQQEVKEGNYIIEISLVNYETQKLQNVAVFTDKQTRIEVKLVKQQ